MCNKYALFEENLRDELQLIMDFLLLKILFSSKVEKCVLYCYINVLYIAKVIFCNACQNQKMIFTNLILKIIEINIYDLI